MKLQVMGLLLGLGITTVTASDRVDVGQFSRGSIDGWQQKAFKGETVYQLLDQGDKSVLQAASDDSASAFYIPMQVDLTKTPVLNWSWQKSAEFDPGDELSKAGDDFVARVYVIKKGGLFFWKTKAINYVWSHQQKQDQMWDNPFAGANAKMLSLRDASHPQQHHRRSRKRR